MNGYQIDYESLKNSIDNYRNAKTEREYALGVLEAAGDAGVRNTDGDSALATGVTRALAENADALRSLEDAADNAVKLLEAILKNTPQLERSFGEAMERE